MNLDSQLYFGNRAKEILDNEVFQDALQKLEAEVINEWKSSKSAADREEAHRYLMTLERFKTHIQTVFETGKLASLEIQHKTLSQRMREQIGL